MPINGFPKDVNKIVDDYSRWLAESDLPKLMIRAEPGYLLANRLYDFARTWPNQTEVTVKGAHFIQETTPDEVGSAIADFVRRLRG
jgi:haloalkane dehalogenase